MPISTKGLPLQEQLDAALATQNKMHEKIGKLRDELFRTRQRYAALRKRTRKLEQLLSSCEII